MSNHQEYRLAGLYFLQGFLDYISYPEIFPLLIDCYKLNLDSLPQGAFPHGTSVWSSQGEAGIFREAVYTLFVTYCEKNSIQIDLLRDKLLHHRLVRYKASSKHKLSSYYFLLSECIHARMNILESATNNFTEMEFCSADIFIDDYLVPFCMRYLYSMYFKKALDKESISVSEEKISILMQAAKHYAFVALPQFHQKVVKGKEGVIYFVDLISQAVLFSAEIEGLELRTGRAKGEGHWLDVIVEDTTEREERERAENAKGTAMRVAHEEAEEKERRARLEAEQKTKREQQATVFVEEILYPYVVKYGPVLRRAYNQRVVNDFGFIQKEAFTGKVLEFYRHVIEDFAPLANPHKGGFAVEVADKIAAFIFRWSRESSPVCIGDLYSQRRLALRKSLKGKFKRYNAKQFNAKFEPAAIALFSSLAIEKFVEMILIATQDESSVGSGVEELSPEEFELYCARELEKMGWDANVTQLVSDQGADVIGTKNDSTILLQCKRHSNPIGNSAVQEVVAALKYYGAQYAAVVGTSTYTKSAKELAAANGVLLLHYTELKKLSGLGKGE